jgi:beta-xylosidase
MPENNPIIRHKFTADPTVIVFNDTVWLYTGHDEAPPGMEKYIMNEWLCFSSTDLINWQEHKISFHATDYRWASGDAYASKVIVRKDKFYWYTAVSHKIEEGKAIGVVVGSKPNGPFSDAKGAALITAKDLPIPTEEKINLDPSVLVDNDGTSWIFWGNGHLFYARLADDMISLAMPPKEIHLPGFSEGAHIHFRNGWYYLSYGYGMPERVAYAMSKSIHGPWQFKGILNELAGNCETNRPAIIDFKGQSYFFYHNGALENGGSHRRSVCIDLLFYNNDDTIKRIRMSSEGIQ